MCRSAASRDASFPKDLLRFEAFTSGQILEETCVSPGGPSSRPGAFVRKSWMVNLSQQPSSHVLGDPRVPRGKGDAGAKARQAACLPGAARTRAAGGGARTLGRTFAFSGLACFRS